MLPIHALVLFLVPVMIDDDVENDVRYFTFAEGDGRWEWTNRL